jgi:hypothetical protein
MSHVPKNCFPNLTSIVPRDYDEPLDASDFQLPHQPTDYRFVSKWDGAFLSGQIKREHLPTIPSRQNNRNHRPSLPLPLQKLW